MKQPKAWDELLEVGYVVELTEEQIAIARDRFRGDPQFFSYANDDHLKNGEAQEKRLRESSKS